MYNYYPTPAEPMPSYPEASQDMYPDVYKRMKPYVENVTDQFVGESLSEDSLDRMAEEAVAASAMMRDPPRGHNSNTLKDIAKLLVLSRLWDRDRDRYGYVPYGPSYYPPYWGRNGYRGWNGRR